MPEPPSPVPPDPLKDLPELAGMIAEAFRTSKVEEIADGYIGNSHYDWQTARIIREGGRIIHHWGVWRYLMRLGSAQLVVGGVGAVATRAADRQRGLMHQGGRAAQAAMYQNGYDLSILHGGHYRGLGYVRAWNDTVYRVPLSQCLKAMEAPPLQLLTAVDSAELFSFYNQAYAGYAGAAVRPTYPQLRKEDDFWGWRDAGNRLAGYVRAEMDEDGESLLCCEAAGAPEICLAILAEKAAQAGRKFIKLTTFPSSHPLLRLIRRGECRIETNLENQDGWKVCVIHLNQTLQKLIPELQSRVADSALAGWTGELVLTAEAESVGIHLADGQVSLTERLDSKNRIEGGAGVARLLIGSDAAEEIVAEECLSCSGEAERLARILFPNLHPVLCAWDEI